MFFVEKHKTEEAFFGLMQEKYPRRSEEFRLILRAYRETEATLLGALRDGGDPVLSHPKGVAVIVHRHLSIVDYELTIASLLHDNVEDYPELWSLGRVRQCYGSRVAARVGDVTKPSLHLFGGDKGKRNEAFHEQLRHAPRESKVIKLADRLHNHTTMSGVDEEKWKRKVSETREFYIPQLAEPEGILACELREACDYLYHASGQGSD